MEAEGKILRVKQRAPAELKQLNDYGSCYQGSIGLLP